MIADPFELTVQEIEAWIRGISYYGLADMVVRNVVSKRADAGAFLARWIEDPAEYVAQSGWDLVASAAMSDAERPDAEFLSFLARIEREIHKSPNRVRHTMNSALIAIGLRNESLLAAAKATAARIGRVHVDHGETGCKTPDAASYMDKTLTYRAKKARA
jgi:3-methyladenine DNA glycosylase AlkD